MEEHKFILYEVDNTDIIVDVIMKDDTLWMKQSKIAKLFEVDRTTISRHLNNIFEDEELDPEVVCAFFAHTTQHGAIEGKTQTKKLKFYNLDAIIAVGYRVNSKRATHFRQWATSVLREYMIKGFALDDDRLKQGSNLIGKDYFKELLERVRSIRASERRIWQQITDIFAEVSTDYDKNSSTTRHFFATVQNKFHYAIIGQTAAEMVYEKADSSKENMGLQTWKNFPGRILKSDTHVAKNYLKEEEIKQLERNVSGYFDYIEDLIERRNTFTMEEFSESVNRFLEFREYDILPDHGKKSMKEAKEKAHTEYDKFNKTQKIYSDFDKTIEQIKKSNN